MAELKPKPPKKHVPRIPPVFAPGKWELADITALQALERGTATAEQQKRALRWIRKEACKEGDFLFRPGEDGRRDTDFALGREFPAKQIAKMLQLDPAVLKRRELNADEHDETEGS